MKPNPIEQPIELHKDQFPLLVITSLVFSLLLIIIGLLLYQNSLLKKQIKNPTPSPSPTPTASTIIDPTVNWKTYTNNKYNYSIKYPADQFINCSKDDEFFLFEGGEDTRECAEGEEETQIYIIKYDDTRSKYYKESSSKKCYSIHEEEITLDGKKANKYSSVIEKDIDECNQWEVMAHRGVVHIVLENKPYSLEIFINEHNNAQIKNQILSTFKFIESSSDSKNTGKLKATITTSPTCGGPVGILPDNDCIDPYANHTLQIRRQSDNQIISQVQTDSQGQLEISLIAGNYILEDTRALRMGVLTPTNFNITAQQTTELKLDVDTGMR